VGLVRKKFPIQGGWCVPWVAAQRAYQTYARLFGDAQSLERLAERGGFGLLEWGALYMGQNPGAPRARLEALTTQALALVDEAQQGASRGLERRDEQRSDDDGNEG
jgi:dihydroorotate dehydrogenase